MALKKTVKKVSVCVVILVICISFMGLFLLSNESPNEGGVFLKLQQDSDGDGLDDFTEIYNSKTNPNEPDTDDDQLNDREEFQGGYNTDPRDSDSDNDGLKDGEEVYGDRGHQTDPNDPDSDDDGAWDGVEIRRGTNPNDKNDVPPGYGSDIGPEVFIPVFVGLIISIISTYVVMKRKFKKERAEEEFPDEDDLESWFKD